MGFGVSKPTHSVLLAADAAVAAGDYGLLRKELRHYAATSFVFGENRWNLLHLACWYDKPEVVAELFRDLEAAEVRAMQEMRDVVGITQNGETPYQLAQAESAHGCLRALEDGLTLVTTERDPNTSRKVYRLPIPGELEFASVESSDQSLAPHKPQDSYR